MNLRTVFETLAEAIEEDSAIISFMQENYDSASVKVFIGVDPEDYPEATENASVYLLPGSRSRTRGDAYRQHNISIICFVNGETKTVEGNVEAIDSLGLLDDFTNAVEECVFKNLQEMRLAVTPLSGDSDEIINPIARSELSYSIEIPSRI